MKRTLCILAIVGILLFGGCAYNDNKTIYDRFYIVDSQDGKDILVDKETKVMYLNWDHGMTVLVDTEGKPLVWEGE